MQESAGRDGAIAFALIYFTFFLDNVLLTVLVPIIPDWVSGEALAMWAAQDTPPPLAGLLNHTVHTITHQQEQGGGSGGSQAVVGLVLGAKAATQLVTAPLAGAAVARRGAAPVLRLATMALALAALGFAVCSGCAGAGAGAALCVMAARATHGAGAALGGVAGLALAAAALPEHKRHRGIGLLLGAIALGVLVGYPFGGATDALWSRSAPFLLIAAALLANLVMQYMFLDTEEYNRPASGAARCVSPWSAAREARRGATGACAGCVALTASVMAALEPCLPPWLARQFHPARWEAGAVFVPDSVGYLLAASGGGLARRAGVERVALAGQLAVGAAALCVPLARSVRALALPHLALGLGLGAADAALVPALLARAPRRTPALAALLQASSAAAYALGPALGGLLAAATGFEAAMRTLGTLNLLYAAYLYTRLKAHPLSEQWGASAEPADEDESGDEPSDVTARTEGARLAPGQYTALD